MTMAMQGLPRQGRGSHLLCFRFPPPENAEGKGAIQLRLYYGEMVPRPWQGSHLLLF